MRMSFYRYRFHIDSRVNGLRPLGIDAALDKTPTMKWPDLGRPVLLGKRELNDVWPSLTKHKWLSLG
jgi:hypothetical protein